MARKRRKSRKVVDPREAISDAGDYPVDTDSMSPEDFLNSPEDFLSVARIANIPAENTGKFLEAFARAVVEFRLLSLLDADRRHYDDAIKKIKTACDGLLQALEYLDEHEGGSAILNCFFQLDLQGFARRPEEISGWKEVAWINGAWDRVVPEEDGVLSDLKHRLQILKHAVDRLSTKKEGPGQTNWDPLHGNKTRTSEFMEHIIGLCEIYGGNLTYNKHYHTGTLADVYEHFRKQLPEFWTDLSPQTLQGLKSSKD